MHHCIPYTMYPVLRMWYRIRELLITIIVRNTVNLIHRTLVEVWAHWEVDRNAFLSPALNPAPYFCHLSLPIAPVLGPGRAASKLSPGLLGNFSSHLSRMLFRALIWKFEVEVMFYTSFKFLLIQSDIQKPDYRRFTVDQWRPQLVPCSLAWRLIPST